MKIVFVLFVVLFVLMSFFLKSKEYPLSPGEELVNRILGQTAKIIKNKYDLKPCGAGAAMPGGPIQGLTLCFTTKNSYTKEKLRELIIKTAKELLNQVTENSEVQKFIKNPPFTINNVQIIIYNHDKNGNTVLDPEISNAQILYGNLDYCTIDPEDVFKYKNEYEETYEEALQALSNS